MTTLREAAQQALEFVTSKQWGMTPYMDVRVYEDAAKLRDDLRAALAQEEQEPQYTTGHCKERAKPNGCQLHNLHCGYPECDRKPAALAQQEQEPVAWLKTMYSGTRPMLEVDHLRKATSTPVYTHPPRREWRGLTMQEINALPEVGGRMWNMGVADAVLRAIRAIEAALKEKNHD
jgi:hypothetical protein